MTEIERGQEIMRYIHQVKNLRLPLALNQQDVIVLELEKCYKMLNDKAERERD